MFNDYIYHQLTALCESENEEVTLPVRYAVIQKSGTPYPGYKAMGPNCADRCLLFKQNGCSVMHAARKVSNPRE